MNKNFALEKSVIEFKAKLGLNSKEPVNLKNILTSLNVITVFKKLSGKFAGMAIKIKDDSSQEFRFMLINSEHSIGKQNFSICHELYHLFVQKEFDYMFCNTGVFDKKQAEEYNADIFASMFLIPEEGVKFMVPDNEIGKDKISLGTILRIEQYYSCSRAALLFRLKELGFISSLGYEKYRYNIKTGAIQYGHPICLYEPGNSNLVLGDYGEKARTLFEKEIISEAQYVGFLNDLGVNFDSLNNLIDEDE